MAGAAAGAGFGFVIKKAGDFEKQMSVVKSLVGNISDNEFKKMGNEAKRLGSLTSFSANEAAQGYEFLSLAGLSAKEQLKALEPVLRTAEAGSMELGLATDIVTDSVSSLTSAFDKKAVD